MTFRAKAVDFGFYVGESPSLVEFSKELLANTCARSGDWIIMQGMKIAGVLRLRDKDAEVLDLTGQTYSIAPLEYPSCQGA